LLNEPVSTTRTKSWMPVILSTPEDYQMPRAFALRRRRLLHSTAEWLLCPPFRLQAPGKPTHQQPWQR
jgi:hypothetical protein